MIDKDKALTHLLDLLAVEGLTGKERKVVAAITKKLITAGCKKAWIKTDDPHQVFDLLGTRRLGANTMYFQWITQNI